MEVVVKKRGIPFFYCMELHLWYNKEVLMKGVMTVDSGPLPKIINIIIKDGAIAITYGYGASN